MNRFQKIISYILVAALASALTMAISAKTMGTFGGSKLDELENLIAQRFIGESDQTAMEDAAAEAMVKSLGDRWSYYIPASSYEAHMDQMNNSYVGIGVTIVSPEDGEAGFEITRVTPGSPAEEAGLKAGDVMAAVSDVELAGKTLDQVRDLVKGESGTFVEITVLRSGESLTMNVERRRIETSVAEATMLENKIGLVTITNFDSRCAEETIAAIEQLLGQGAEKLIFDVRNNPGGYKDELVKVLDYLLPEGPLFRSEDYKGNVEVDSSDAAFLDVPMAVLVNGASYSAAEFFAAALSEYDAAVVVGEKTSGKGYFQVTYRLSDGSAVGLSIGKYTTPNEVSLAGVGITPDIVVEADNETAAQIYAGILAPEADPQVQAAVKALENP